MLPNLIIIGGLKCGTSSLHFYLSQHPQVFMSRKKELNFFLADRAWNNGIAWYEQQFANAGAALIRGESSPHYTGGPQDPGVPERMRRTLPDARLVFLVRDPIERLVSHYMMWFAIRKEDRPFEAALADLANNPYVGHSRYGQQLETYLRHFPREQIRVIASESLRDRRRETLRELFGWLGVDSTFYCRQFEQMRFRASDQRRKNGLGLWLAPLTSAALWKRLPPSLAWRVEKLPYFPFSKHVPRPEVNPALRQRLMDVFRDDVRRLRELTGQPLSHWCV